MSVCQPGSYWHGTPADWIAVAMLCCPLWMLAVRCAIGLLETIYVIHNTAQGFAATGPFCLRALKVQCKPAGTHRSFRSLCAVDDGQRTVKARQGSPRNALAPGRPK